MVNSKLEGRIIGMKFYIATGLSNSAQHNLVRDYLVENGHEITYDWTIEGPAWNKGLAVLSKTAQAEVQGVLEADLVIVILPEFQELKHPEHKCTRGTHVELGVSIAHNIETIIHFPSRLEDMAYGSTGTCAFYHFPNNRVHKHIGSIFSLCRDSEVILRKMKARDTSEIKADKHMRHYCEECYLHYSNGAAEAIVNSLEKIRSGIKKTGTFGWGKLDDFAKKYEKLVQFARSKGFNFHND